MQVCSLHRDTYTVTNDDCWSFSNNVLGYIPRLLQCEAVAASLLHSGHRLPDFSTALKRLAKSLEVQLSQIFYYYNPAGQLLRTILDDQQLSGYGHRPVATGGDSRNAHAGRRDHVLRTINVHHNFLICISRMGRMMLSSLCTFHSAASTRPTCSFRHSP